MLHCSFPRWGKVGMGARQRWYRLGASSNAACPHPCPPPEGEGERHELRACMRHCGAGLASVLHRVPPPSPPPSPRGERGQGREGGEGCEQAAFHLRAGSVRSDGRLLHCSFPRWGKAGMGARRHSYHHDAPSNAASPHPRPLPKRRGSKAGPGERQQTSGAWLTSRAPGRCR